MFASIVSLDLKPNTHKQFSELFPALLASLKLPWLEEQITTRQIPICRQCRVACVSSIAQTS